jgi:hypothetical protein
MPEIHFTVNNPTWVKYGIYSKVINRATPVLYWKKYLGSTICTSPLPWGVGLLMA